MLKDKKGQMGLEWIGVLLLNPWILLGIGLFILVVIVMGIFFAWKFLALAMILLGGLGTLYGNFPWYVGLGMAMVGIFILWNPGEIMNLSATIPFTN